MSKDKLNYQTEIIPTPISLPNKHRKKIDWEANYGSAFKVVQKPENFEHVEDTTLIITPENKNEWNCWVEASKDSLCKVKKNWDYIQRNLSEHKYNQILKYIHTFVD
jgi:hypothetical protein